MVAARLANLENGQKASSAHVQSTAPISQSAAADMLNISRRSVTNAARVQDERTDIEPSAHGQKVSQSDAARQAVVCG